MNPIVTVDALCMTFHKGIPVEALRGVDMTVGRGEFVSIVGRSGSGKSTLLNIIGGLASATSGSVVVKGKDLSSLSRPELAAHRKHTVGMIFQSFNLIPSRTALENVTLALAFGGTPPRERKGKAARMLASLGLESRMDHVPGELSGGEAQRVAIARALINAPEILLADEPTGNLDSGTSRDIIGLLASLNRQGTTLVMVTHDEASASEVSHRVLHLLDGRIVDEVRFKESA